MAAQEPARREPHSLDRSVALDRLRRVRRTGGKEPARRGKIRRDRNPVERQHPQTHVREETAGARATRRRSPIGTRHFGGSGALGAALTPRRHTVSNVSKASFNAPNVHCCAADRGRTKRSHPGGMASEWVRSRTRRRRLIRFRWTAPPNFLPTMTPTRAPGPAGPVARPISVNGPRDARRPSTTIRRISGLRVTRPSPRPGFLARL